MALMTLAYYGLQIISMNELKCSIGIYTWSSAFYYIY